MIPTEQLIALRATTYTTFESWERTLAAIRALPEIKP